MEEKTPAQQLSDSENGEAVTAAPEAEEKSVKPQAPILEEKYTELSPAILDELADVKERIVRLFDQVEDNDINRARKIWRELNSALIHSFSLGVFDMKCEECGTEWTVARRQALNEVDNYLHRRKKCPNKDCESSHISLDWDLQISVHDHAKKKREEERLAKEQEALALAEKLAEEAAAAAEETDEGEAPEEEDGGEFRPLFGE
ncbi:MAG: hypothetical protein LBN97_06870 [Oscillospiraceae bacterium]|jgi:hypothetical protein|nr:hypothetical protein [Oscillospiraceae bacterium]